MRMVFAALVILAASSSGSLSGGPAQVAQLSGQDADQGVSPYDAGFAFQAGKSCPGVSFVAPMDAGAESTEQFKRGVAMFNHYLNLQKLEGACKAALTLYNLKTGKVAKLLHQKID